MPPRHIAIIGGGPAGLTAAYLLTKENMSATVIEADPRYVGGISRTVNYHGYRFDIGGLENGVVNLINRLPEPRWRHAVLALTESNRLTNAGAVPLTW